MIVCQFLFDRVRRGFGTGKRGAEKTAKVSAARHGGQIVDSPDQTLSRERLKKTEAKRGAANAAAREGHAHHRRLHIFSTADTAFVERGKFRALHGGRIMIPERRKLRCVHGSVSWANISDPCVSCRGSRGAPATRYGLLPRAFSS